MCARETLLENRAVCLVERQPPVAELRSQRRIVANPNNLDLGTINTTVHKLDAMNRSVQSIRAKCAGCERDDGYQRSKAELHFRNVAQMNRAK